MSLFSHTVYINLNERTDRLQHVKEEMVKLGVHKPTRIVATKHEVGAIGCVKSHIRAIEYAISKGWEQVFVCEDDITFLDPITLRENAKKFALSMEQEWDVLIIGGNCCPPYTQVDPHWCQIYNCQTTTGYIVRQHYYSELLNNFREGLRHLLAERAETRKYALDMYWKRLQQRDKWFILVPLTVTQYENYSDIEKRQTNYNGLMLDMEKKWLYR
jgi:glycosyl transferase family 25